MAEITRQRTGQFLREIVARIETERAIVHGNRKLIRLYEEKVKKVIPARGRCERVWEA